MLKETLQGRGEHDEGRAVSHRRVEKEDKLIQYVYMIIKRAYLQIGQKRREGKSTLVTKKQLFTRHASIHSSIEPLSG